jgi:sensor histidine kinase YesM
MTNPGATVPGTAGAARAALHLLWRQALWAVPFALFFGLLSDHGGGWRTYAIAFRISLVFSYAIGIALWVTRFVLVPRLHTGSPLRIGLAYGVSTLLGSYVAAVVVHVLVFPGFLGTPRNVLVSGIFTLLFFALFSGIQFAIVYYRQAVDRARALETVRAELAEAELRALRAQIHPHFLFNTLNTIAALIRSDPAAAEETTARLADLFRYALRASEREHSPLADELEFLRDYLAIERTRFGERLRVEERIQPGLGSVPVPSLLLQPLVENAVRHGLARRDDGGRLLIEASRRHETVLVAVEDDGTGFDPDSPPAGGGFGIHSVRERLRAAGPPHAIEIHTSPGRGTRIELILPLVPGRRPSLDAVPPPCPGDTR